MSNDNDIRPRTGSRPFQDVLLASASRRATLAGGLAVAATTAFAANSGAFAATGGEKGPNTATGLYKKDGLIGFTPVSVADGTGPMPSISPDYEYQVLASWGEPIQPDGPAFSWPPSSADQAQQVGTGHDGLWFFPIDGKSDHGMLVINQESGINPLVIGKPAPTSLEDVRASQHAAGVSIIEIKNIGGTWQTVSSDKARRIHANTPVTFSGPVAGDPLLDTPSGNAPLGTMNNCAIGVTPWSTYLTCEENFNKCFGANGAWTATARQKRYGLKASGGGFDWSFFDPRFDLSNGDHANEEHRFGWVVEIDPMDPSQTPVKRTAMGRIKHEGAAMAVGRGGRVVAYMGDDQRFDYIYKFVSDGNWESMRARGLSPLDHGKLYAAKFNDDGTGDWLELTIDNPALAAEFDNQIEVLTFARVSADLVGATPMDRPEWTTVAPNGDVYCALTNNNKRKVADAANPMAPNKDGHIIRWHDSDQHTGETFEWDIFLIAKDTHGTESTFSDPDGLWADPDGRLFIGTDGGQKDGLNNQLLVADTYTGEVRRLFTGVTKDEITGIAVTPDRRTMFINIQHPGVGDPSKTNFPAPLDGVTMPRDSTVVISKKDGGIIGS